jgi:hypothetical protein
MAGMIETLEQMLGGQADKLGSRIGADPAQTQTAVSAAIPVLVAALGQEASSPGLRRAIERDHDGAVIDNLDGYVEGTASLNPRATDGVGILEHTLGDRQQDVARSLSSKTGLDLGSIMQLLPILAPIVMGMLGKQTRSTSSGSGSGGLGLDALGSILGGAQREATSRNPDIGDILGGLVGGGSAARGTGAPASGGELGDLLGSLGGRKPQS